MHLIFFLDVFVFELIFQNIKLFVEEEFFPLYVSAKILEVVEKASKFLIKFFNIPDGVLKVLHKLEVGFKFVVKDVWTLILKFVKLIGITSSIEWDISDLFFERARIRRVKEVTSIIQMCRQLYIGIRTYQICRSIF